MELMQAMQERRSIRSFEPNVTIDRETVYELIRAAQLAPSWKNTQTGRYYAVLSKEQAELLRTTCLPDFNQPRTVNAAAFLVTTFEKGLSGFDGEGNQVGVIGNGWGAYDLGLQTQNLMLRARELGLDTLIMGMCHEEKIRVMLKIPESQQIAAVIAIGKRTADPIMPKRKEISEILTVFDGT